MLKLTFVTRFSTRALPADAGVTNSLNKGVKVRQIILYVIFVLTAFSVINAETPALQEQELRERLQKFEKAYVSI